jgi:hypothetical protein
MNRTSPKNKQNLVKNTIFIHIVLYCIFVYVFFQSLLRVGLE